MTRSIGVIRIAALAGRRVDAPDADDQRFPLQATDIVRERICEVLQTERVEALACSAACGADLLALDVAADLEIAIRVVLPYQPSRFREISVVDRPGPWGEMFDRVIAHLAAPHQLIVLDSSGTDPFAETNRQILATALNWNQPGGHQPVEQEVLAIAVWDGHRRGPDDMTADFIEAAYANSLIVREISTLP